MESVDSILETVAAFWRIARSMDILVRVLWSRQIGFWSVAVTHKRKTIVANKFVPRAATASRIHTITTRYTAATVDYPTLYRLTKTGSRHGFIEDRCSSIMDGALFERCAGRSASRSEFNRYVMGLLLTENSIRQS